MPSQRLLKMLDPLGHLPVLASRVPVAVVWAGRAAGWIGPAVRAAGLTPLAATSMRHVRSSLYPSAKPYVAIAIIDFDLLSEPDAAELVAARWCGFRGAIIAVAKAGHIDARRRHLIDVDEVVGDADSLRAAVARSRLRLEKPPR